MQEFDTFDAAVAALYSQLEPGGSIAIHDESCALNEDGEESDCSCIPLVLSSGAQA